MRIHFVRRSPDDVNAPTIRSPTRNARSKVLVGISDAPVMLFLKVVFWQVWIAATPQPKLLNELLALFASAQLQKRGSLFRRDDVHHVFLQPLFVLGIQLFQGPAHL